MNETHAVHKMNHAVILQSIHELQANGNKFKSVTLLSPDHGDYRFYRLHFPDWQIFVHSVADWNLHEEPSRHIPLTDLAIASNVFMYSSNPDRWIENVMRASNVVLIQDLKYRRRSQSESGFGEDGDCQRYTRGPALTPQPAYNLERHDKILLLYTEYAGTPNEYHGTGDQPVHICAAFQNPHSREHVTHISYIHRFFYNFYFAKFRQRIWRLVGG